MIDKQSSQPPVTTTTQTGQVSCMPSYLLENYNMDSNDEGREVNNLEYDISLTPTETKFYAHTRAINEIGFLAADMEQNDLEQEHSLVGAA
eukprot:879916-Ditylum_brightwellii.AAC.1